MVQTIQKKRLTGIVIISIFSVALTFRIWMISLVPQSFLYDQTEYEWYAQKIYNHPMLLASHTYRSYVYPLFLAVMYRVFGFGNHDIIYYIQAVVDACTALLVYFIIANGLKMKQWAYIGAVLYAFNPLTSGYTGVILTEVLTTFCIAAVVACGVQFLRSRTILWAFLLGIFTGITGQARNQALVLSIIPMVYIAVIPSIRRSKQFIIVLVLGYLIPFTYPLLVNWRDYREVSFTTVDNMFVRELFNGANTGKLRQYRDTFPPLLQILWAEFHSELHPGRTSRERKMLNAKYFHWTQSIIREDPVGYINMRFEKIWFMWQKEAIYIYQEPGFHRRSLYTYVGNLLIIIVAFYGLFLGRRAWVNDDISQWVIRTIKTVIIIATVGYSLTIAEQRYTIVLYPYVFVGLALGLAKYFSYLQQRLSYPNTRKTRTLI